MPRAVRGRKLPTLDGVSKTTNAYRTFEKTIIKCKIKFYDMHGNLMIGDEKNGSAREFLN